MVLVIVMMVGVGVVTVVLDGADEDECHDGEAAQGCAG